jgi:transposase InsO family protein
MDRTQKKRRRMIHRRLKGWKIQDIATALRTSEKTVDRWCSVYRKRGWAGLHVKSHRPHTIHRTSQEIVNLVLQLRRTRNWGPCRIEGYLRNYHAVSTSHTTIHKILNHAGLNNPILDLDDHSRFIPGSTIHHNPTAEHAIKLLEESVKRYGKPDQVLTDRGSQFYPERGGRSEFTELCSGNGIQHIVASVRRPSTIGKIEAFHKAYTIEASIYPTQRIRELLELRASTSRNRLSIPSGRILQRPDTSQWITIMSLLAVRLIQSSHLCFSRGWHTTIRGSTPIFQEFAPTKRTPYSELVDEPLSTVQGSSSS